MSVSLERTRRPKFLENSLLAMAGVLAHVPLVYQLPRWANGLDPTFVHPMRLEHSPFSWLIHLARVHPIFWILLTALIFFRICRNYGWTLEK